MGQTSTFGAVTHVPGSVLGAPIPPSDAPPKAHKHACVHAALLTSVDLGANTALCVHATLRHYKLLRVN